MASTNAASTSELDWPTLIVGGIFFLVGASLGGVGLWNLYDAGRAIDGEQARAEVLRKAIHVDRTQGATVRPRYRVEYRFTPARGEPLRASADVAPELWARLEPRGALEVTYLASDPRTLRVEGEQHDLVAWLVFAAIGVFFAPVGAWLARNGLARAPASSAGNSIAAWFARAPALSFGVLGLVFFLPFAAGGVFWLDTVSSAEELLDLRGQQVEGIVLSKAVVTKSSGTSSGRSRGRSTHYHVNYRFNAEGAEVVGKSSLDSDDWERLKERGPIAVRYAGGSPWLHRIEGESAGWIAPFVFLGIGGLGMLGSGAAAIWGWRSRGRPAPKQRPKPEPKPQAVAAAPSKRGWMLGAGIGAFLFFGGCGALFEGVSGFLTERRYSSEGQVVDARVTQKAMREAERSGRRSTEYAALYRFTAGSAAVDGRAILEVSVWEATKPGDVFRVRYLASAPQINRPADEGGVLVPSILTGVGILFALIGAFIAWGSWLVRNDP